MKQFFFYLWFFYLWLPHILLFIIWIPKKLRFYLLFKVQIWDHTSKLDNKIFGNVFTFHAKTAKKLVESEIIATNIVDSCAVHTENRKHYFWIDSNTFFHSSCDLLIKLLYIHAARHSFAMYSIALPRTIHTISFQISL